MKMNLTEKERKRRSDLWKGINAGFTTERRRQITLHYWAKKKASAKSIELVEASSQLLTPRRADYLKRMKVKVADALRRKRFAGGWSQRELSARIGTHYTRAEGHPDDLSLEKLICLALAMGLRPKITFEENDNGTDTQFK